MTLGQSPIQADLFRTTADFCGRRVALAGDNELALVAQVISSTHLQLLGALLNPL